jgi:hypothetical protein
MTSIQIDREIASRRAAIRLADRTIADTKCSTCRSVDTDKALVELTAAMTVERVVLAELEKYRRLHYDLSWRRQASVVSQFARC